MSTCSMNSTYENKGLFASSRLFRENLICDIVKTKFYHESHPTFRNEYKKDHKSQFSIGILPHKPEPGLKPFHRLFP